MKICWSIFKTFVSAFVVLGLLIWYIYTRYTSTIIDAGIFENIAQSAIGSLCFFAFIFFFLKPSIIISSQIAKNTQFRKLNEIGNLPEDYIIKIINTSFFRAIDITVCIYEVTYISDSGTHFRFDLIHKFLPNKIGPPFLGGWIEGTRSSNKDHALQIRLNKEAEYPNMILDSLNNQHAHFLVTINVKNSFSGISSTFTKRYDDIGCVHTGKFKGGNSFMITT